MPIIRQLFIWNPNGAGSPLRDARKIFGIKPYFCVNRPQLDDIDDAVLSKHTLLQRDILVNVELNEELIRNWIFANKDRVWVDVKRMRIEEVRCHNAITDKKRRDFTSSSTYEAHKRFHVHQDAVDGTIPAFTLAVSDDGDHARLELAPIVVPMILEVDDNLTMKERKVITDWSQDDPFPKVHLSLDLDSFFVATASVACEFNGKLIVSRGISPQLSSPAHPVWESGEGIVKSDWLSDAILNAITVKVIDLKTLGEKTMRLADNG